MLTQKRYTTLVVGARPNFIKAAPLWHALQSSQKTAPVRLIHTGQHFDENMSTVFFRDLQLPEPDTYLGLKNSNPATQIGQVILQLGTQFAEFPPEIVVVFGDVNSTLATAITANKMALPLAHVEAGLRSFDRSMPEEHNRVLTDHLADLLFTPSADASENLIREGVSAERIHQVGNIMVDSLLAFKPKAAQMDSYKRLKLNQAGYALLTLHRPGNVDAPASLKDIWGALLEIAGELPVVFPVHPRTRQKLSEFGLATPANMLLIEPQSYLDFLNLMMNARIVLTDSGGVQEETTVLGIPCLTLRDNTERPITVTHGTNRLAGTQAASILQIFRQVIENPPAPGAIPPLWDGKTGERIAAAFEKGL